MNRSVYVTCLLVLCGNVCSSEATKILTLLGTGNASWCPKVTELKDYSGYFQTPFHDSFYPTDTTCVWKITAPAYLHVKLSFRKFHLEECKNCACDFVTIYDVTQDNKNVTLGKYCGKNKPGTIYSTWQQLIVVFVSDHGDSKSGFMAEYAAITRASVCKQEPNVLTNGGPITSPEYTQKYYPPNSKCVWIVQGKPHSRVRLKFLHFQIENCSAAPGRCQCDFVEVRDGNSSSSFLIGRFCGRTSPPILYSSGRYLWVEFRSDNHVSDKGFVAQVSTQEQDKYSCPADWKYPFQCPKDLFSRMRNISQACCYDNGANCCKPGGNYCKDSGASQRNYCPRPKDDKKFTRCCMVKEKPACCLAGANSLQINRLELLTVTFISLALVLIIR